MIDIKDSKYTQVKVSVEVEIATAFKTSCAESGESMAGILSQYMAKHSGAAHKSKPSSTLSSKRQRRTEITKIIKQLESVLDSEESYKDRIPETLQSSEAFENAEQWVSILDEVIELLEGLP